eukprot:6692658-Pyramimonas_sp.AAC.1
MRHGVVPGPSGNPPGPRSEPLGSLPTLCWRNAIAGCLVQVRQSGLGPGAVPPIARSARCPALLSVGE